MVLTAPSTWWVVRKYWWINGYPSLSTELLTCMSAYLSSLGYLRGNSTFRDPRRGFQFLMPITSPNISLPQSPHLGNDTNYNWLVRVRPRDWQASSLSSILHISGQKRTCSYQKHRAMLGQAPLPKRQQLTWTLRSTHQPRSRGF